MRVLIFYICVIVLLNSCQQDQPNEVNLSSIPLSNNLYELSALTQAMAGGDTVKIVCYGNSVTYGVSISSLGMVDTTYPIKLQKLLQAHYQNDNITVVNEGHGGWTAPMAAEGLDTLVTPQQADWVLIMFGINDHYQGVSLSAYEAALTNMVISLKNYGSNVMILSPTPVTTTEADMNGLLEFCKSAKKVADIESVAFFHMNWAMVNRIDQDDLDHREVLPDHIHFADEDYALIGEELFEFLKGN